MQTHLNKLKGRSIVKRFGMTGAVTITLTLLGGCLTSPYYGQIFNARTDQIPFEIWTYDKNQNITLE